MTHLKTRLKSTAEDWIAEPMLFQTDNSLRLPSLRQRYSVAVNGSKEINKKKTKNKSKQLLFITGNNLHGNAIIYIQMK